MFLIFLLFILFAAIYIFLTIFYILKYRIQHDIFNCTETYNLNDIKDLILVYNDNNLLSKEQFDNAALFMRLLINFVLDYYDEGDILIKDFKITKLIKDEKDNIVGFVCNQLNTNKYFIIFKGTYKIWQVIEELKLSSTLFYGGTCHKGIISMYKSIDILNYILNDLDYKNLQFIIGGHSLGGAYASLLSTELSFRSITNFNTYTIGNPRICSYDLTHKIPNIINIQNISDIIINIYNPIFTDKRVDDFGMVRNFEKITSCKANNHFLHTYYTNLNNIIYNIQ